MATLYLALGTNLGDKEANLRFALKGIAERIGKVERVSRFLATAPWGFESKHTFLNAACRVHTLLSPLEVLDVTQALEREMGRTEKSVNGVYHDRIIDIDLLMYDNLRMDSERLTLPHPRIQERDFVRLPLQEVLD